jgi:hypothetical protein
MQRVFALTVSRQWPDRERIVSGEQVDSGRTISGQWADREWTVSGPCVDGERTVSGRWADREWTVSGPCVDGERTVSGRWADRDWTVSGPWIGNDPTCSGIRPMISMHQLHKQHQQQAVIFTTQARPALSTTTAPPPPHTHTQIYIQRQRWNFQCRDPCKCTNLQTYLHIYIVPFLAHTWAVVNKWSGEKNIWNKEEIRNRRLDIIT